MFSFVFHFLIILNRKQTKRRRRTTTNLCEGFFVKGKHSYFVSNRPFLRIFALTCIVVYFSSSSSFQSRKSTHFPLYFHKSIWTFVPSFFIVFDYKSIQTKLRILNTGFGLQLTGINTNNYPINKCQTIKLLVIINSTTNNELWLIYILCSISSCLCARLLYEYFAFRNSQRFESKTF